MISPLRVGIVPYLNMLPLVHGLGELRLDGEPDARLDVIPVVPSEMTRMMENGRLDIGMVPVGGLFDHPEWRVVGRSIIGSRGPVLSVLAVGSGPIEQWTRLHPDSQSRTSNALVRVILAGQYGTRPEPAEPTPTDPDWTPAKELEAGGALVVIGSRALRLREFFRQRGDTVLDLGEAWMQWTGLPFVYAVWAAREGVEAREWITRFDELRCGNERRLRELVAGWPGLDDQRLTPDEAFSYLTDNIKFDLDEASLDGLRRFHTEGEKLQIFKPGWKLRLETAG